jgi:glycosyltransferase involved in cell wall biosynthesis
MKIAFDAKRAFNNYSGLGNYARSLMDSIIHYFPENEYHLYTPKIKIFDYQSSLLSYANINIHQPQRFFSSLFHNHWRSYTITNELIANNVDVYHGLSNEIPSNIRRFSQKKIVSIHDLIFLRFPELYPVFDRQIYDSKVRNSCKNADCVIAISEQTKKDIIHYYRIPEAKIKVLYQSCNPIFRAENSMDELKQIRKKYNLPSNFILSVGTIEQRKNLLTLLKALNLTKDISLVVVGKKTKYYKRLLQFCQENDLMSRVFFLNNVPTSDLPSLYKNCNLFVYPSVFEGFGIPVLEAINCKVPVIAALGSSLIEVGGKDSLYFDPYNHQQLAELILNVINSSNLRQKMIDNSWQHAQKFLPQNLSAQLMKIYTN